MQVAVQVTNGGAGSWAANGGGLVGSVPTMVVAGGAQGASAGVLPTLVSAFGSTPVSNTTVGSGVAGAVVHPLLHSKATNLYACLFA